jgi:hypothetical protein
MIMQPPRKPQPQIIRLAEQLGQVVDQWQRDVGPLSWMDILQALEWMRFRITETLIEKNARRCAREGK